MKIRTKAGLGALALAAITLLGAPSLAQAAETCTETVVQTGFEVQELTLVTPEVPGIPEIPAVPEVPAQPAQGFLEVPGDWAEDSVSVPWSGTIADLIGGLDIAVEEGSPIQYVGIHFTTALGTFVYEEDPSYAGTLWSKTAWSGVPATYYAAQGTIEQYAAEHGAEPITAVTVIYTSPTPSSTTVTSVTLGGQLLVGAPAQPAVPGVPAIPAVPAVPAVYEFLPTEEIVWAAEGEEPVDTETTRFVATDETRDVITEVECPVTPAPAPSDSTPTNVTPAAATNAQADSLADTGTDETMLQVGLLAGGSLLLAGLGTLAVLAVRKRALTSTTQR